jgi:hypothetical protein
VELSLFVESYVHSFSSTLLSSNTGLAIGDFVRLKLFDWSFCLLAMATLGRIDEEEEKEKRERVVPYSMHVCDLFPFPSVALRSRTYLLTEVSWGWVANS